MAKTQFPMMPKAGGGVLAKLVGVVLVLAVLTMVVKQPAEAAVLVKGIAAGFGAAAEGAAAFLQGVLG
ncbi:hypothetical protein AB0I53_12000 [Saccharopolyspora sp. NPDC050389]|uniref:hypothetical protein n=1 Tax=Saccharopolyspora sp. NPDC050389 TaxID=3155516 RepID=UPI0033EDA0EC